MNELSSVVNHSVMITIFVFVMMLLVDYINVLTKGDMEKALKGGRSRQYAIASFLGATPGCLGAFANVSFYVHGVTTHPPPPQNLLLMRLYFHHNGCN